MTGSGQLIVRGLVPDMPLEFNIKWYQFNSPSEHIIDGRSYDLELQIVHSIVPDYLPNDPDLQTTKLVISVLFNAEDGANNTFLNTLNINTLDTITDANLKTFLESMKPNYIYYQGSLTTPPCTENVHHFIFTDVQLISYEQLKSITDFYQSNTREDQPINNRKIYKVTKRMSRSLEGSASGLKVGTAIFIGILIILFGLF